MKDLTPFAAQFDASYPRYADERYTAISALVHRYGNVDLPTLLEDSKFKLFVDLLEPLIEIKNYKSQVPFPCDLPSALSCIYRIRTTSVSENSLFEEHERLFKQLIEVQGFQLPTVSAVFHFCHPRHFPIVDRNVARACALLKVNHSENFIELPLPVLPKPHENKDAKLVRYRDFVAFLSKVVTLQRRYLPDADYRFVDKALMVIGVQRLREQVR